MKLSIYESRLAKVAETKGPFHAGTKLTSSTKAIQFCLDQLSDYFSDRCNREEVGVVTLDTKKKVTGYFLVSSGTLDASLVHPREVFRPAIQNCAASILLVHNHPTGDPTPSPEDLEVTRRLEEAGEIIGIDVIDHIIVGEDNAVSIREYRG
jgi:DNA repair protein RadC